MRRLLAATALVFCMAMVTGASATMTRTVVGSQYVQSWGRRLIVAGSNRHTLYEFTRDQAGKSVCYGKCSATWVPLWAKGKVVAAAHSRVSPRKLGKVRRRHGSYQITYYGHPLYLYKGDEKAGQVKGGGDLEFNGAWYPVSPDGQAYLPRGSHY